MSRKERDKGLRGEREVAALYSVSGLDVRGLEATGDHLIVCSAATGLVIHSEVKRQETARPWAWMAQAEAEAEDGAVPVVHFRRNGGSWYAMLSAVDFARIVALYNAAALEASGRAEAGR